jgi:hypothetical protein
MVDAMSPKKRGALFCCLAAWCVMAAPAWAGTIKGVVRATPAVLEQKTLSVTIDQYVCGQSKPAEDLILSPDGGVRYAVVSIQNPPPGAKWNSPLPHVRIDQRECVFVPHVAVVPVGGTVDFLNSDRLLHNLHSFGKENLTFNRAQPSARTIPIVFSKPEIIRVDCDLHAWMRAWVVVAEHPFYAVTNERGEFAFEGVPPGKYTLRIWQEILGTVTVDVNLGEQGTATVTVELRKN